MGLRKHNFEVRRSSRSLPILLHKYTYLSLIAYRRAATHRVAYLLSLLGNIVRVIAFAALWQVALSGRPGIGDYSQQTFLTYVLIAFMLDGLISFRTESLIAQSVRTGDVFTDLIRPLNHQILHFSNAIGTALIEGIWLILITGLLGYVWLDILIPQDWTTVLFFLISVILAIVIKYDIAYLTGVAAFWLTDIRGLIVTRATLVGILGGAYFPLELLPHSVRSLLDILPFAGTIAIPARIFTGQISGEVLWTSLIHQLFWAVVLWLFARMVWNRAVRRVSVNGG
ncbi:ABC transporter permease [Paenibacillus radicis (ex Xue et al. 2023)]|uniref:ABC-2 family transporter protein n=1 Tax=Paenibacillus radicis (ex Xue et al. 2023) TaxID=2972489 RepID=A0ABT1YCQ0_9BACL|nr:ABC-2 family transporter protein [Paenibacillus radicis (ex Xue et al. 2023)]MCR8630545.1 ABC-2 family transporter protein [Paenibacillus radicis (ex Xue et al. 2023)]